MKKTISIILACVMLVACFPLSAMAETIVTTATITGDDTYDEDTNITGTVTVTGSLTIASGVTVTIKSGGSLSVTGSGKVINNGTITVAAGGSVVLTANGTGESTAALQNAGTITLASESSAFVVGDNAYVYNNGTIDGIAYATINGKLYHSVNFGNLYSWTGTYDASYVRNFLTISGDTFDVDFTVKYVLDKDLESDTGYTDAGNYSEVFASTGSVYVENGTKLYIMIIPEDGVGDWVDTGRMQLNVNNTLVDSYTTVDNSRGVFLITPTGAISSMDIVSKAYKDIVKLFEITLPRTDGYYVTSLDGDIDTCTVQYGTAFSFRVVLSEDYDQSEIVVYADAAEVEPDEYGYYDITGPIDGDSIATAGGVQDNFTIRVMGVTSNEARETVSGILSFIQEIFSLIASIFEYFTDLFSGLFS